MFYLILKTELIFFDCFSCFEELIKLYNKDKDKLRNMFG